MPKPTKPPVRAKRPRAEAQQEFSEISDEVAAAKKIAELKREESLRQHDTEVRVAVEGVSVEGVVQKMPGLGLRAKDQYDDDVRLVEKKNKEKKALEKDWVGGAAPKEQEEELVRLRKEAQEFAAPLCSESEQAAAQATKSAQSKFEQDLLILKKDVEADKRVADHRIKPLEETISGRTAQIAALQKQLDQTKQQVQEIALQAIEGASGAKPLAHINQIAMEQARPRSPQG